MYSHYHWRIIPIRSSFALTISTRPAGGDNALDDAIDFRSIRSVLVTKLRYHGDVLLSSPVFTALQNAHPHLAIDALVYADTQPMLANHPAVRHIFTIDKKWRKLGVRQRAAAEWGLLQTLRGQRYDLLIHLTEHWRGPLLKRLLGIPYAVTADYARRRRSRAWQTSFTHRYPVPKYDRHKVESHLDALRRIGVWPTAADKPLRLVCGEAAAHSAQNKLDALGLAQKNFILVHPTSRFLYKCLPVPHMAELIARLQTLAPVVLTAAPAAGEMAYVSEIMTRAHEPPLSLAGELSLPELAHCIGAAALFVGVDSAPMHMAAAVQTPLVALFGPTSQPVWGPWQVPHRIVATRPSCQPCQLRGCGNSHRSACLEQIAVEDIYTACREILSTPGAGLKEERTRQ